MSEVQPVSFSALRPIRSPFALGLLPEHGIRAELDILSVQAPANDQPDDAYMRGFADGEAAVRDAFEADQSATDRLARALERLHTPSSDELALVIARTVQHLVVQIVGETPLDADEIRRRAERAAMMIAEEDKPVGLSLHPDDAALLPAELHGLTIKPRPDLARGDVVIDHAHGTIEDRVSRRLAAMDAALGLSDAA